MADNHQQAAEYLNMGISLMRHQKYAEAKEYFSKALAEEPGYYEAYMHLGNACVNLGELDDAVKAFINALTAKPDSGETLFSLGNVYFLQDNYVRAIKYYNKAEAVGFCPVDMYLIMAEIFENAGDAEQTLRCLNRALKVSPLRGDVWRKKVLTLLESEKFDAAEEALNEFTELLPDALDAYDLRTRLLCGQGRFDEALAKLQPARERFPDDPQISIIELNIYSQSGNVEKAKELIHSLKTSGKGDDYRKIIALEEGQICVNEGDADGAVSAMKWALETNADDADLLYMLLTIYTSKLRYKDIIATADRIIALKNVAPAVLASSKFYRAMSLKETGSEAQAKAEFRHLSKEMRNMTIADPSLSEVFMLRILCHCQLEEFDAAFQLADYLQNVSPDSADGHAYRHLIYKQMGDEEKSQKELELARQINPDLAG